RGLEAGKAGGRADRLDPGEIRGGEDAALELRRDADMADPRMRDWAAQEGDLQHAGQRDVADELTAAAQMAVILLAQDPRADAGGHGTERAFPAPPGRSPPPRPSPARGEGVFSQPRVLLPPPLRGRVWVGGIGRAVWQRK